MQQKQMMKKDCHKTKKKRKAGMKKTALNDHHLQKITIAFCQKITNSCCRFQLLFTMSKSKQGAVADS